MNIIKKSVFVAALYLGTSLSVSAQGIPVIDGTSIANLISQLRNQATQIQNQVEQINEAKARFEKLQEQLESITGDKGISDLLNSGANQTERQAASGLDALLNSSINGSNVSGGNTGRLNDAIQQITSNFDLPDFGEFQSSDKSLDKAIAQLGGAGITASATAQDTYVRTNEGTARVNSLISSIDTQPDLKASVDLNTRVLAEVAQQLNELIRLQAAVAQSQGNEAIARARDLAAARKFGKLGN